MAKYTKKEIEEFINEGDAQRNESGSVTWSINNKYGFKPGTFLCRPPGAADLITSADGKKYAAKRWEIFENLPAFEQWRQFRQYTRSEYKVKPGYIYFVRALVEPYLIKIGRSVNPLRRINNLGTSSPVDLELLLFISVPDMSDFENLFHNYFSERRVKGEWFEIKPNDIYELLSKFWREPSKERIF